MVYAVDFAPGADREFRKLAPQIKMRLQPRIDALANNPRPPRARKLRGAGELWRIRVGEYRIIYEIRDKVLLVLIVRIAHRREAYR